MAFRFTKTDIRNISGILGVTPKHKGNNIRFELGKRRNQRPMTVEIYPDLAIGKQRGNLISVYTPSAHLQLHFCTGYVISKVLNEVTFVSEKDRKVSGIIIEREGGCSLYANVDREILSGDFTQLGPEVMLSGIALSLSETVLTDPNSSKKTAR